jgi:predicted AlkP superfamily pyrophosphatase or phosphodiesterase
MKLRHIAFLFLGIFLNSAILIAQEKPQHLILISLDGYRYDYTQRFAPENIQKFIKEGVAAESMMSSFPSKTFPNHYTIATGLRPENHGLVDNSFYDPQKDQTYGINNREMVSDPYWYDGHPIWVLASQAGMVTASYFFVGTEAPVQGVQPNYFYNYDGKVSNLTRISKVFEWLELPEEERPRVITLYFSDMDDTGHRYGPDNDEQLAKTLHRLDRELGALFEGLKSFDLDINVVLVSDHGMTNVTRERLINLDEITQGIDAKVVNDGALAHVYLTNVEDKPKALALMRGRKGAFQISDVDDFKQYQKSDKYRHRLGDLLILPDLGYYLATPSDMVRYQNRAAMYQTQVFGEHGYDPKHQDMHGIFYAKGPKINNGLSIPPFQNIHIYPLLVKILGLTLPEGIDGDESVLKKVWKD